MPGKAAKTVKNCYLWCVWFWMIHELFIHDLFLPIHLLYGQRPETRQVVIWHLHKMSRTKSNIILDLFFSPLIIWPTSKDLLVTISNKTNFTAGPPYDCCGSVSTVHPSPFSPPPLCLRLRESLWLRLRLQVSGTPSEPGQWTGHSHIRCPVVVSPQQSVRLTPSPYPVQWHKSSSLSLSTSEYFFIKVRDCNLMLLV